MTIEEAIKLMKNEKACILKADTCDRDCAKCELLKKTEDLLSAYDMVIRALEMQKKLAEYSGMDICNWVQDYNYVSKYEYETSVDDFLIDEIDEEAEEKENNQNGSDKRNGNANRL